MPSSSEQDALIPDTLGGCKLLHPNDKCHACSAKPADYKLSKCSRCKWALYCDATCQKAHWEVHKPECKYLRADPKTLRNGVGDIAFDHVREMVECIRRGGRQALVKDLCVSEMTTSKGETLKWIFEENMESKDFTNKFWACKRDH